MSSGGGGDFEAAETAAALGLIDRIITTCPERQACSHGERQAQALVRREFEQLGLSTEWAGFRFNDDLYSVLALHFGLGTLGSVLARRSPLTAAALHLAAAISYWADSTQRGLLLRRLRPFRWSQNLLATLPARQEVDVRIVIPAHIDAAFTGWLFRPQLTGLLKAIEGPDWLAALDRPLRLVTLSQLALAGLDVATWVWPGRVGGARWLRLGLSVPALAAAVLTAEVAGRGELVPGANDDLTGVAATVVLARRLQGRLPPNVEVVFVVTGAEEAGLGGARALARSGRWDPERTVVLGLDGLCGGRLRYFVEGEVERVPVPAWIERALQQVIRSDERFAAVEPFAIPVGYTDVYAFRRQGFDGVCLGCVDDALGSPRHYHLPTDTVEHLDARELGYAVDFAERVIWEIIERRAGP